MDENHICELGSGELYDGRSSQLYTGMQLLQLRKERLKAIQAVRTLDEAIKKKSKHEHRKQNIG